MSDFVRRFVEPAVDRAIGAAIDEIIIERINRPGVVLQRWVFEAGVAGELRRADPTLTRAKARDLARNVVEIVVEDAGEYGNPAYSWDLAAAQTCAREVEIAYWEPRP